MRLLITHEIKIIISKPLVINIVIIILRQFFNSTNSVLWLILSSMSALDNLKIIEQLGTNNNPHTRGY